MKTKLTYQNWKQIRGKDWKSEPISCTCELLTSRQPVGLCRGATVAASPCMGGGWQSLCAEHAAKHPEAFSVYELIADGETW